MGIEKRSYTFQDRKANLLKRAELAKYKLNEAEEIIKALNPQNETSIHSSLTSTEYTVRVLTDMFWVHAMETEGIPEDTIMKIWDRKQKLFDDQQDTLFH